MKFDVCVMNPPYQAPKTKAQESGQWGKSGTSLWDKFVEKAIDLTSDNGYLCAVHPSRWRKPNNKTGQKLLTKQIKYLEMHNEKDGLQTFGAETRYDWYVAQNKNTTEETLIKDQDGNVRKIDLGNLPFIPNAMIDEVLSLFARKEEDRIKILHSFSAYETRSKWMSKNKTEKHIYPCVYTVTSAGEPSLFYSSVKDKGHFSMPKLIFSSGRISSANYFIDKNGEYGLTQFAKGIVDSPENLPKIYQAMRTDRFKKIMESCAIGLLEINKDILSLFKKDFWREFI